MCPIHQNILNLKPSIENKKTVTLKVTALFTLFVFYLNSTFKCCRSTNLWNLYFG